MTSAIYERGNKDVSEPKCIFSCGTLEVYTFRGRYYDLVGYFRELSIAAAAALFGKEKVASHLKRSPNHKNLIFYTTMKQDHKKLQQLLIQCSFKSSVYHTTKIHTEISAKYTSSGCQPTHEAAVTQESTTQAPTQESTSGPHKESLCTITKWDRFLISVSGGVLKLLVSKGPTSVEQQRSTPDCW